jgi:YfaZ precursor
MLKYSILALAALLCAPLAIHAQENSRPTGEIALSNETLQLRYLGGAKQQVAGSSQVQGTVFLSEDRDLVLSAAVLFPVDFNLGSLSISFGPQIYAALLHEENDDIMALSVGLKARYLVLPGLKMSVGAEAFYAPDILTFGSADNLTDLSARVEFDVASNVMVFGGYRWFEFDLTEGGGTQTLQEQAFAGFGYRF